MKYALINCYSDNNKGDLGIILSTIQFIKAADINSSIIGLSTYNESDPLFHTEHSILSKEIAIYPSIFGELNIGKHKNIFAKIIKIVADTFRLAIFLILPKSIDLIVFGKNEKRSFKKVINADFVISKGGSFLCNEKNIREQIGLIRFLYIFLILIKYNKKYIIHCQSLGPIYGFIGKVLTNHILNKSYKVILREDSCINQYSYIKIPTDKLEVLNDIAFFLKPDKIEFNTDKNKLNIGFTLKSVRKNLNEAYIQMILDSIIYCVKEFNADIYIFPHVTIDNDMDVSFEIYKKLPDSIKSSVFIYTNNYTSSQLKYMYSEMDLFIGTRLHSTIFAMGENIPAICIAYHGTKAQGIFKNFESSQYVIENYSSELLINAINKIIPELKDQSLIIKKTLTKDYIRFKDSFKNIFIYND